MDSRSHAHPISCTIFLATITLCLLTSARTRGGALENYVQQPDAAYSWKLISQETTNGFTLAHLDLASQKWRDSVWHHDLLIVRPKMVRNPDIAFLFITGDGSPDKQLKLLTLLAERAGAIAAVITRVPNQPLYDGRKEDALIAYTFSQFLATGDETWPLLFPMTKSAVRGLDAVQAFAQEKYQQKLERFVVSGASKRGWTTWLTGAVDKRVAGIAPMVIDMLNMKVQTEWQRQVYGKQSEMVKDYTDANLLEHMDDPRMVQLRGWVDPFSYCARYTMPKLLLLGTNDPYWTVDSLRFYWDELPEPKLVYQTPNAGHNLNGGIEATPTLAAFFQMIADRQPLPKLTWTIDSQTNGVASINEHTDAKIKSARLWTATSSDRDFRNGQWSNRELKVEPGTTHAEATVEKPAEGYRAFLLEAELISPTGAPYKLSTAARVIPDTTPLMKSASKSSDK
jgi:PhoPQ-activated pathogenicity-related protein